LSNYFFLAKNIVTVVIKNIYQILKIKINIKKLKNPSLKKIKTNKFKKYTPNHSDIKTL